MVLLAFSTKCAITIRTVSLILPVRAPPGSGAENTAGCLPAVEADKELARYLASINLSSGQGGKWNMN